jgi:hypothetical protein
MQAPAHPDDETNALFAMFTFGMGLRSIDLQNNRGDGGQNEIGPELFRDMAVLRTAELMAAHRIDGAEQYFTRAIDYGYSFDPQEVISKWGRKEIVGDYVRLIRTLRPDVVLTMNIQGRGGDRAHEATTILFREAYQQAGDPSKYPEQLREGLSPGSRRSVLRGRTEGVVGGPAGRRRCAARVLRRGREARHAANTSMYDPLLGRTYAEIGTDARSNHKCQGTSGLPPLPGFNNGGRGGGRGRRISTHGQHHSRPEGQGRDLAVRRRRHQLKRDRAVCRPQSACSLDGRRSPPSRRPLNARNAFDSGNDAGTAAAH